MLLFKQFKGMHEGVRAQPCSWVSNNPFIVQGALKAKQQFVNQDGVSPHALRGGKGLHGCHGLHKPGTASL